MNKELDILKQKLADYKKKFYFNQLVKNALIFIAIVLTLWLVANSIEFTLRLGTTGRATLFFTLLLIFLAMTYQLIIHPFRNWIQSQQHLSDEKAAQQIGDFFPDLGDKLLNTIQLTHNSTTSDLLAASIEQRAKKLSIFQFSDSIDLSANKKYIKYIVYPGSVIVLLLLFVPQFLTESTTRIVNYNKEFEAPRLFSITPLSNEFHVFKNEDFDFQLKVEGAAVPDEIFVLANGRRYKMSYDKAGLAYYKFNKVQQPMDLVVLASDYRSRPYHLEVRQRPDIRAFNIQLSYPAYTKLEGETISNIGNVTVPEGTSMTWLIETIAANQLSVRFSDKEDKPEKVDNQLFKISRKAFKSEPYRIMLQNEHGFNKDSIIYSIDVVKDEYPKIGLSYYQDTTLFSYVVLSGQISDDYGISLLELVYEKGDESGSYNIPFSRKLTAQNFFYQWTTDSLDLRLGDKVEFFVRVWDNDGINGRKASKSGLYSIQLPDEQEIDEKIEKQSEAAKNELERSLDEAKDLNEQIKSIQDQLKSKKETDWQDNKRIQDLIKQKENLEKELNELSKKHKDLTEKREHFEEPNKSLQEKAAQLQQLMDEILDEETKKLYEELQKLLEENSDTDQIENLMNQIQNKEENMEKEIERAIEMFKRMQFDFKMDEIINDLDKLQQEQEESAQETESKESSTEEMMEKQKQHQEDFEKVKEEMEKLQELNEDLKQPEDMESLEQEQQDIDESMQESMENLNDQKRKKAAQSQQKSSDQLRKMKEKMADMQAGMAMQMMTENLQHLRAIVENLIKLSFDQEQIMQDFRGVSQSDPRYVDLSQKQLKLKDDAVIIEDSLLSLATRVFQIQSFVTRELDEMNDHIQSSLQALKDRHKPEAVTSQQFAMTSINNLALLLDDVLQQMMQQMADAMGQPQSGQKGKESQSPQLSELQKQLNQQIQELQKSGKTGRQLSQKLAELAAEQEMLRQKLQQMEEQLQNEDGESGGGLSEAIEKMEETEMDLVNKNITRRTLQRQEEILTRMLEAENAMRERELDKERKGEEAEQLQKQFPPSFEEYFKAKEKELDLLHSVPSKMSPYYKEEVNKYFKRLNEQ